MRRFLRGALTGALIVVVSCVVFDVAAWFLAPKRVEYHFPGYRFRPYAQRGSDFGWHFPRYHFAAHPTRGIDLTPGGHGTAFGWGPFTFALATNSLGCRDDEFAPDGRPFLYAAGDSQTMGYVDKEQRWPDLLAQKTGLRVLNCGVAGTAQWHQRDKFIEIAGRLGAVPELVLVGYVYNDALDDRDFPAQTVVEGYPVFRKNADRDRAGLVERIRAAQDNLDNPPPMTRLKWFLKQNSLITNMIFRVSAMASRDGAVRRDVYPFSDAEAGENRRAIAAFKASVCALGSRFAMILLPNATSMDWPDYYREVRLYLDENQIYHLDLHEAFARAGITGSEVAQPTDPHLSIEGNARVAEAIASRLAQEGTVFGACARAAPNGG
jgi:lysophospholipase L1-like esterase